MKIKAIITGATGMVGEGVLHECLNSPEVEAVLVINRKPSGVTYPKLKEIIHSDFYNLSAIENELTGYNACFFCLGVSSLGMKEEDYFKVTYTLTMHVAQTLSRLNSDMVFCYVSGRGTDSTEKGRFMWARVKGKTENDLAKLPFKSVYAFRPGLIRPTAGLKNTARVYALIAWLLPLVESFAPGHIISLSDIGLAMIHAASQGYPKKILDPIDIARLAKEI
jgi:uncharacterized protein YbjT (DUF2867 family)